jgi:hypothetical protein
MPSSYAATRSDVACAGALLDLAIGAAHPHGEPLVDLVLVQLKCCRFCTHSK